MLGFQLRNDTHWLFSFCNTWLAWVCTEQSLYWTEGSWLRVPNAISNTQKIIVIISLSHTDSQVFFMQYFSPYLFVCLFSFLSMLGWKASCCCLFVLWKLFIVAKSSLVLHKTIAFLTWNFNSRVCHPNLEKKCKHCDSCNCKIYEFHSTLHKSKT